MSSDQKVRGIEEYGLGGWHPGLLGPRVGDCEGMAGLSCLLSILAQKSGLEAKSPFLKILTRSQTESVQIYKGSHMIGSQLAR